MLLTLPANIRVSWKRLPGTNPLAYCEIISCKENEVLWIQNVKNSAYSPESNRQAGTPNWGGRLTTIDPIKLACFCKKCKWYFYYKKGAELNYLVQGGQMYWAFPFNKTSLDKLVQLLSLLICYYLSWQQLSPALRRLTRSISSKTFRNELTYSGSSPILTAPKCVWNIEI